MMQRRYHHFNPKRKIQKVSEVDWQSCADLAEQIRYGGNPEHKMNPGDFGLTPPSGPMPGKSLCGTVGIFTRHEALAYLQMGLHKGMISERHAGKWPQYIWAVTKDGDPLEAHIENPSTGTYHGYPMPDSDPLAAEIVRRWKTDND